MRRKGGGALPLRGTLLGYNSALLPLCCLPFKGVPFKSRPGWTSVVSEMNKHTVSKVACDNATRQGEDGTFQKHHQGHRPIKRATEGNRYSALPRLILSLPLSFGTVFFLDILFFCHLPPRRGQSDARTDPAGGLLIRFLQD